MKRREETSSGTAYDKYMAVQSEVQVYTTWSRIAEFSVLPGMVRVYAISVSNHRGVDLLPFEWAQTAIAWNRKKQHDAGTWGRIMLCHQLGRESTVGGLQAVFATRSNFVRGTFESITYINCIPSGRYFQHEALENAYLPLRLKFLVMRIVV